MVEKLTRDRARVRQTVALFTTMMAPVPESVRPGVAQWSIGNLSDPVVLVAVSLVLFVVTMMSAAIPANRAASIQPADALRTD